MKPLLHSIRTAAADNNAFVAGPSLSKPRVFDTATVFGDGVRPGARRLRGRDLRAGDRSRAPAPSPGVGDVASATLYTGTSGSGHERTWLVVVGLALVVDVVFVVAVLRRRSGRAATALPGGQSR